MMSLVLLAVVAANPGEYALVETVDGVRIESRPVEGSSFVELKMTTTTSKSPNGLCDAVFGDGSFDAEEPDLKSRKILSESADERVTYDQISPPLVSNRDYAVRAKRIRESEDRCTMTFEAANDVAPESPKGWVRVAKLKGYWRFERQPSGTTELSYVVFTDPGGAIPPFMAEGSRRKLAVKWVKMIVSRAK